MKVKKIILVATGLLLSLLCACLPTPDESFIPQKDITLMIEQAKATPNAGTDSVAVEQYTTATIDTSFDNAQSAQTPEYICMAFSGKTTNHFNVNVNAKVAFPMKAMPIIRVSASDINDKMVNRFFSLLTENYNMYTPDQLETVPVLDKKIKEAMDEISNGNDEQPMKDYLNMLIEKRKTASEDIGEPIKQYDMNQHECLYSIDEMQVFGAYPNTVLDDSQESKEAFVFFRDNEICKDRSVEYRVYFGEAQFVKDSTVVPVGFEEMKMTPIDAEIYVNTLLDKLELNVFSISGLFINKQENDEPVYIAICDRVINGIPVTHPAFNSGSSEDSVIPIWGYEQVIICFNDKGLAYFGYKAPLAIENTVVEQSNLLPFNEIMTKFQNMIIAKYEVRVTDSSWGIASMTIRVTDLSLTLQRINEQDNIDYGLLVPVWNIWGYVVQKSVYEEQEREGNHINGWPGSEPLLTINAITGDVIDPHRGY